jgi:hypothetical protein
LVKFAGEENRTVKNLLTRWVLGLSMLFTFAALSQPADAQVVVKVGPTHRRYYHHRHVYYRHGHRYYR